MHLWRKIAWWGKGIGRLTRAPAPGWDFHIEASLGISVGKGREKSRPSNTIVRSQVRSIYRSAPPFLLSVLDLSHDASHSTLPIVVVLASTIPPTAATMKFVSLSVLALFGALVHAQNYFASCQSCGVVLSALQCDCGQISGGFRTALLDLNYCLINANGNLQGQL